MEYQKLIPGLIIAAVAPSIGTAQIEVKKIYNEAEIQNYIKKLLSEELGISIDKINANSHLHNELGMDSLDAVILIMKIEKHLDCSIPDELAERAVTVEKTVEMAIQSIKLKSEEKEKKYKIVGYGRAPFNAIDENTGKYGYITKDEKIVIDFKFDRAYDFHNSSFRRGYRFAWVKRNEKYFIINPFGEPVSDVLLDSLYSRNYPYTDGDYTIGFIKGKVGVINAKGKVTIPFVYDKIRIKGHTERDFIIGAYSDDEIILFDRFGNEIPIKAKFDKFDYAYDRGKIITFLERENQPTIEAAYDLQGDVIFKPGEYTFEVNFFTISDSDGIKFFKKPYHKYFYDEEGDDVLGYNKHNSTLYATVKKDGKIGVVDTEGNILVPFQSKYKLGKYLNSVDRVLAYDFELKKFGFLNGKGEIIIPFNLDIATNLRSISGKFYYASTMINGKKYGFDENGNWIDGNGEKVDAPRK